MSEVLSRDQQQDTRSWERTRLFMRRPWLEDLPAYPQVPDGCVLRTYRAGEQTALAHLLTRAFEEPWDLTMVEERLTAAPDVRAIYVIADEQQLVATASARLMPDEYPGAGYVHWVAVDPEYQGRGLGALVTMRVLEYFRAEGLESAVLETHSFRLAAQRTYLRMGFVPESRDRGEQLRWAQVLPQHLRDREVRP